MFVLLGLLITAHLAVMLVPASWLGALGLPSWARFFSFAIYPILLMWWIRSYNRAETRERLRVDGGVMLCWNCGYELPSPAASGAWPCTCPECGTRWPLDDLYRAWRLATPAKRPGTGPSPGAEPQLAHPPVGDASIPGKD